jgi:hypothetical protein
MPKARPTVVSFWVWRPEEFPDAADYPAMLRILDASCRRLGLRHVVLTDMKSRTSALWPNGLEAFIGDAPKPLMRACTALQAQWLEAAPDGDTLFVGADCIMLADPARFYPAGPGLCVTYRHAAARYPINTGAILVRQVALDRVAPLFRRIAERCGETWCDDQRAIQAEFEPMPAMYGIHRRHGIDVAFLPMARFNVLPAGLSDQCRGVVMLHFRGKARKQFFFDWAARHGYA